MGEVCNLGFVSYPADASPKENLTTAKTLRRQLRRKPSDREIRAAATTLDLLHSTDRAAVMAALPERTVSKLHHGLERPSLQSLKHVQHKIEERYLKVYSATLEGPPAATQHAKDILLWMVAERPELQDALVEHKLHLSLFPRQGLKFKHVREAKWYAKAFDSVRPVAGSAGRKKVTAWALDGGVITHELAHWFYFNALSPKQKLKTFAMLQKRRASPNHVWASADAKLSTFEYFAHSVEDYFGARRSMLKSTDPEMFGFVESIFGPRPPMPTKLIRPQQVIPCDSDS